MRKFNETKRVNILKEARALERDVRIFRKKNPDFLNNYNKYLDNLLMYKELKKKTDSSNQEQFCGLYNV